MIDTIGVDPGFTGAGIGSALLSQLFVNLEALRVERVATVVARDNFGLLGVLLPRRLRTEPAAGIPQAARLSPRTRVQERGARPLARRLAHQAQTT